MAALRTLLLFLCGLLLVGTAWASHCGEVCQTDGECPDSQCFRCKGGRCDSPCGMAVREAWDPALGIKGKVDTHTHMHTD